MCVCVCECAYVSALQMALHWPSSMSPCSLSLMMPVECLFKQEGREKSATHFGRHWTESMRIEAVNREARHGRPSVSYSTEIC